MLKLTQCLCPKRHCIMASLDDGDYKVLQDALKNQLRDLIRADKINPWCAICGAKPRDWFYETQETIWATKEEAMPFLLEEQAKQLASTQYLKATGEAYDSPRRN